MPANVESMMSVKEKPWHGIGTVVDEYQTAEQALVTAGLDWQVSKQPVFYLKDGQHEAVKDKFVMVRSDNNVEVGVVGKSYTALQNSEAFSFMDAVIGTKEAIYETAGSLGRGEKVWMMAKIDGVLRINETDDVVEKYLLVSNSHNGSSMVNVALTSVRVVCANTLTWALNEAKQTNKVFKFRHSKNMGEKVIQARESLNLVNSWFDNFNVVANSMANTPLNQAKFKEFVKGIGLDPNATKGKEKSTVETLTNLFENGDGNNIKGVKRTLWAALNGVTQYVDHERSTRKTGTFNSKDEARLASAWFGSGNTMKEKALEVAVGMVA